MKIYVVTAILICMTSLTACRESRVDSSNPKSSSSPVSESEDAGEMLPVADESEPIDEFQTLTEFDVDEAIADSLVEEPPSPAFHSDDFHDDFHLTDIERRTQGREEKKPAILVDVSALQELYEGESPEERAAIAKISQIGKSLITVARSSEYEGIRVRLDRRVLDDDMSLLLHLDRVVTLDLSGCYRLTNRSMATIGKLTGLRTLFLTGTDFTTPGFDHLATLKNLKYVALNESLIKDHDLKVVGTLPALQRLVLQHTRIGDAGIAHLSQLTRLQELDCTGTDITDAGARKLAGLTSLERISLQQTSITDESLTDLAKLPRLKSLSLYRTNVTDKGVAKLAGLRNLQDCSLIDTLVTQAGYDALAEALPDADIDYGSSDRQADRIRRKRLGIHPGERDAVDRIEALGAEVVIGEDRRVWWVFANLARFSDNDIDLMRPLSNLQRLELSGSRVSDAGLAELASNHELKQVFLFNTEVTIEGLRAAQEKLPAVKFFR